MDKNTDTCEGHTCDQCGKCFANKHNLKIYLRTHTGERPYSCSKGQKCFTQLVSLNTHIRTHTGEKPYICKQCGQSFTMIYTLQRHMKTHTGEKPHVCKQCEKGFTEKQHLLNHMRTHTGERPYKCIECGNCCTQVGSLQRHMTLHCRKKATISREQFPQDNVKETESKLLPINNVSAIEGVVMQVEYASDCVETSAGVNQTNPLNVNIVQVETIVDKSEIEDKTIIQVKKEASGTHYGTFAEDEEITMNVNTVKVEGVKKELLPTEEYTYL